MLGWPSESYTKTVVVTACLATIAMCVVFLKAPRWGNIVAFPLVVILFITWVLLRK